MANHVTNVLSLSGPSDTVAKAMEFIGRGTEEGVYIDLANITPMPPWIYGSNPDIEGFADVMGFSQNDAAYWREENMALRWSIINWGTKWNAYDQNLDDDNVITFDTAWSAPITVISKISWIFPGLVVQLDYADEDIGQNTGSFIWSGVERISGGPLEDGSKEAFEMAFLLKYGDGIPVGYKFDEATQTYIMTEEE